MMKAEKCGVIAASKLDSSNPSGDSLSHSRETVQPWVEEQCTVRIGSQGNSLNLVAVKD